MPWSRATWTPRSCCPPSAPPENLIRRAGRVNRRGDLPAAQIVIVGDDFAPKSRPLTPSQSADYLSALRAQSELPFDAEFWKAFI